MDAESGKRGETLTAQARSPRIRLASQIIAFIILLCVSVLGWVVFTLLLLTYLGPSNELSSFHDRTLRNVFYCGFMAIGLSTAAIRDISIIRKLRHEMHESVGHINESKRVVGLISHFPLWVKITLPIVLVALLVVFARFAVPPLYAEWRHPNNINVFDEMYYASSDSNINNMEYSLPGSNAELIYRMNGIDYQGGLLSSYRKYTYLHECEAEQDQLYCADNESLYFSQDAQSGTQYLGFRYNVYFEKETECLKIDGRIDYNPKNKQLEAVKQTFEISSSPVEGAQKLPISENRWNEFKPVPEAEIPRLYARFNKAGDGYLSYNKYFLNKVVCDFIAANSDTLPYSPDYWGEFTCLQPELLGKQGDGLSALNTGQQ